MASLERRSITVNGVVVEIDTKAFEISDVDEAQRTSAATMAFWASVCGSAEAEAESADAHYRKWRGEATKAILEADPKAPEWKVKAAIEAHKDFLALKTAIAQAADNLSTAQRLFASAEKRCNLAQSIGALARETMSKTGRGTTRAKVSTDDDDSDSAPVERAEKVRADSARLRGILGKKRKATDEDGD